MAFLKLTGTIASFTEMMQPKYSQVDDLIVTNADGRRTKVSSLYLRNDMLQALQQAQVDGAEVELFLDRRPTVMGHHQMFGFKSDAVAVFDRRDPTLLWNAIPSMLLLVVGWLISVQYFHAHVDATGFLFAAIIVQVGMMIGSMHAFLPLSIARFTWQICNRLDREKLFYVDAQERDRLHAREFITA
jgi:hypothetical protein